VDWNICIIIILNKANPNKLLMSSKHFKNSP